MFYKMTKWRNKAWCTIRASDS